MSDSLSLGCYQLHQTVVPRQQRMYHSTCPTPVLLNWRRITHSPGCQQLCAAELWALQPLMQLATQPQPHNQTLLSNYHHYHNTPHPTLHHLWIADSLPQQTQPNKQNKRSSSVHFLAGRMGGPGQAENAKAPQAGPCLAQDMHGRRCYICTC
jgi:hypothetical protein